MPIFVPSQIRDFLDERVPVAKAQPSGGTAYNLSPDYAGLLGHLLFMIDHVPEHLLTLRGQAAAEFGESVHAIRMILDRWRAGDLTHSVSALVGKNGWNPVTFIRKHLDSLADQADGTRSEALTFIGDPDLKASVGVDLYEMDAAVDRGAWKAATVLAGSVAETLLLNVLLTDPDSARTSGAKLDPPPPKDLTSWSLHHLTEVAANLQKIRESTAAQCRVAKDFRNLIHPGRALLRLALTCDRGTALAAVAAVEHIIRDLRSRAV